jgi:hypothetical protein
MPNTTNRHSQLQTLLTQLNLTAMAESSADIALRAAKEGLSHEAYLYELARASGGTAHTTTHCTISAGFRLTCGENVSDPCAQSPHPDASTATGESQECFFPGNGDQCSRHWQTRSRQKSLSG